VGIPPWEWPADAGTILIKVLEDESAAETERVIAAELAGDLVAMNDKVAGALLAILKNDDEPELLRAKSAIAFGPALELGDGEGFDEDDFAPITEVTFHRICVSLREVFESSAAPKLVRRRALEASVRAPQDWEVAAIRQAYASDDREWRLTAVFCMRYVQGFKAEIAEAMGTDDEDILCEAVGAAGAWGVAAAWPRVADLLASADTPKPLLLEAIEAAGGIGARKAASLVANLCDCDDEEISDAAYEALGLLTPGWSEGLLEDPDGNPYDDLEADEDSVDGGGWDEE
jgi:hypothetical protein